LVDPKDSKLLLSGKMMVIPELQELGVTTEDMIAELEELLVKVGTGPEASTLRARLQSP
jgi:hypothetical protein